MEETHVLYHIDYMFLNGFKFCAGKEIVIFQDSDAFVMIDKVVNDYQQQNDLVGDARLRSQLSKLFYII